MIAYQAVLTKFCDEFGGEILDGVTSDQILDFLNRITEGTKQQTRHVRYGHLSAFFNFITANIDPDFHNPCSTPILRKMFKAKAIPAWEITDHPHSGWFEEAPSKGAKSSSCRLSASIKRMVLPQLFPEALIRLPIQMPRHPFSKFSMMAVLGEMPIGGKAYWGKGHLTVKVEPLGSHGRSPWFN